MVHFNLKMFFLPGNWIGTSFLRRPEAKFWTKQGGSSDRTHSFALFFLFIFSNFATGEVRRQGDGWLSWQRACLLRQLSGFESRHLSKIQNVRHQQRSGQHTLARQKNIQKRKMSHRERRFPLPVRKSPRHFVTSSALEVKTQFDVSFYGLMLE